MSKTFEFVSGAIPYLIATVENTANGPEARVRPFGSFMEFEGDLYFFTSKKKNVYKQLKENASIQIVALQGREWVRITGKAIETEELRIKEAMIVACPNATKNFPTADHPDFAVFKIADKSAVLVAGPSVTAID